MARYIQRKNEEEFSVPSSTIYRIGCCDCGLVHDFVFCSHDGQPIVIAARRNNRATAAKRRKMTRLEQVERVLMAKTAIPVEYINGIAKAIVTEINRIPTIVE